MQGLYQTPFRSRTEKLVLRHPAFLFSSPAVVTGLDLVFQAHYPACRNSFCMIFYVDRHDGIFYDAAVFNLGIESETIWQGHTIFLRRISGMRGVESVRRFTVPPSSFRRL